MYKKVSKLIEENKCQAVFCSVFLFFILYIVYYKEASGV